jgi:pyridoxamine 5'-phosphate oxidase
MATTRIDELDSIEAALWRELGLAASGRDHAWRQAVLATIDGDRADARTVVLREVNRAEHRLTIFTDERSPKVRQIMSHPQGTLVMWSDPLGWQLRLSVRMEIETAGLAVSSRWARLKMTPGAHDYLSPLPPGSTLDRPAPERGTREYFAVLTATVLAVDWLELHADGHRRAVFDAQGRRWVAP